MKKHYIKLLSLLFAISSVLFVLGAFSCREKEERFIIRGITSKLLIISYLEPNTIYFDESRRLCFDGKIIDSPSEKFKTLSIEHGETGDKEFICWGFDALYSKLPLNIEKIKFFDKNGKDISNDVLIYIDDIKGMIDSGYENITNHNVIKKMASELDKGNLYYIHNRLDFDIDNTNQKEGFTVEVTLSNDKVLKTEYKGKK